jgi:hypothetical protein
MQTFLGWACAILFILSCIQIEVKPKNKRKRKVNKNLADKQN